MRLHDLPLSVPAFVDEGPCRFQVPRVAGIPLLVNGDAEGARRVRELSPDWTSGPLMEGLALYHLGRHTDAIAVLRGLTTEWTGSGAQAALALACAASGDLAYARELLLEFEAADEFFATGLVRLALGERERAFEAFERVDDWGYWESLCMHSYFPDVMAPLRADPLYHRMRGEMDRAWGRTPKAGPAVTRA